MNKGLEMHQIYPVNDVTAGTRACYGRQVLIRVTSFAKANNVFGGFVVFPSFLSATISIVLYVAYVPELV